MYKVVRKNKSYDKRKLVIYDDEDNKIVEVEPCFGWFCWSNRFDENYALVRMEVLKNLYWLVGRDCDGFEWNRRIEHWDEGKGVDGPADKISQFHNIDEKIQARLSFDNK